MPRRGRLFPVPIGHLGSSRFLRRRRCCLMTITPSRSPLSFKRMIVLRWPFARCVGVDRQGRMDRLNASNAVAEMRFAIVLPASLKTTVREI